MTLPNSNHKIRGGHPVLLNENECIAAGTGPAEVLKMTTDSPLSPELIASLGTASDSLLAARHMVSVSAVKGEREKLGIPSFALTKTLPDNPDFVAVLGTTSDSKIAQRFKCSTATVARIRTKLGVPAFVPEPTPELIAALGTMSDIHVAAKFGYSTSYVRTERYKRGIKAFCHRKALASNDEFNSLLGTKTDDALAYQFACSVNLIRRYRAKQSVASVYKNCMAEGAAWQKIHLSDVLPLLGTMADGELARRYGGASSRYSWLRKQQGIKAFVSEGACSAPVLPVALLQAEQPPRAEPHQPRRTKYKPTFTLPEEVLSRLGKVNDKQLSRETGIASERITTYRAWLLIPPYRKRKVIEQELIDALGTMKDMELAVKFGRSFIWVKKERIKRGIPSYKISSIPGLIESLGTMHDYELAQKYEVSCEWVKAARRKRGIAIFSRKPAVEPTDVVSGALNAP